MAKFEKLFEEILFEISLKPSEINYLNKKAKEIIRKINSISKNTRIILGGSLAKNTIIRKKHQDVDLFVIFNSEEETKKLGKILTDAKLETSIVHGSRDYFQLKEENIKFELIPIVKLDKNFQNKNTSDFSPLHVKYISEKIKKNSKLSNEIKLAKQFCIAQEVYGAESYIGGFSGYSLELLVVHYEGFIKFLKGIQKDSFIDIEKNFKNKREAFRELNSAKLESPIVLIDPTYRYRNVCAGLTAETFEKFKTSAKNFLKNPSKDFFKKEEFNLEEFIKKRKNKSLKIYKLEISTNRENFEVGAMKMKKFFNFIKFQLEKMQQKIYDEKFLILSKNKSEGYLILEENRSIKIEGPKKDMKQALENFKRVHKKIYFSKDLAYALEEISINKIFENQKETAKSMGINYNWSKLNI